MTQRVPQSTAARIETRTDAEGRFLLEDVPVGTYTVFVERGSFKTSVDSGGRIPRVRYSQ